MNLYSIIQKSCFSSSTTVYKQIPTNLKGKSQSSQAWLKRQINDSYVKEAKYHNFRCRSAFKLLQIQKRFNILKPGDWVIDCGASPGSWSQVAATETNSNQKQVDLPVGRVIGIDLRGVHAVDGVTFLSSYDFTSEEAQNKLLEILAGEKVDVILSDMAPNCTGIKSMDHDLLIQMSFSVLKFAITNSKIDGTCLIKLWAGRQLTEFEIAMRRYYNDVRHVKPEASRSNSAEVYLLGRNFKGLQ